MRRVGYVEPAKSKETKPAETEKVKQPAKDGKKK